MEFVNLQTSLEPNSKKKKEDILILACANFWPALSLECPLIIESECNRHRAC